MKNLTLKQLRYFEALARDGRFRLAAEACAISQPALSMQIKELEAELGNDLFERSAREVKLTAFGETFALRARAILSAVDELADFARTARSQFLTRLRIGIIPTVAPYLLPAIIKDLNAAFEGIQIEIRETQTAKLVQELAQGNLDMAIVALPVSEPSLTELKLFDEEFVLVRRPEDEGKPVPGREDLKEMRLLLLEEGHCFPGAGPVLLQYRLGARARGDGGKLALDAGADGQRRHRGDADPADGGAARDALRRCLNFAVSRARPVANDRYDLAQFHAAGRTIAGDRRLRETRGG